MPEIWKPIESTGGVYEASSLGRIRSLDRTARNSCKFVRGKIMTPSLDKDGYLQIAVSDKNKKRTRKVHRLVAEAFLPGGTGQVNHKDFNKANNTPENLEWVTPKGNQRHAADGARFSARINPNRAARAKMTPESVAALRKAREGGATYKTLGKKFGISLDGASKIARGKLWA